MFAEDLEVRQVDGPSTRLDIGGIKFSEVAEFPATVEPHLFVIVRCAAGESSDAVLEVKFMRGDEQVARNVQPLQVEPTRFAYRLVRAELDFDGPGTVEAHCSIDRGEPVIVPFSLIEAA
ncbi:MAG: hypothetical protein ABGZ36_21310 [Actinomycetota bacterium]